MYSMKLSFFEIKFIFMQKIVLCFIMFLSVQTFAQDEHYSQFKSTGMQLNPALTGETDKWTLNMGYRLQWPNISGTYQTTTIGAQYGFSKNIQGVGLLIVSDIQGEGTIAKTAVSVPVSKRIQFSENINMTLALQPTFYQKTVDWTKLTFGDMIDNKLGFQNQTSETEPSSTILNADLSSGIIIELFKVEYGLAVYHLFEPDESFFTPNSYNLPRRWSQFITYELSLGEVTLSPFVQYDVHGDFKKLLFGNTVSFKAFKLFTAVRNEDAVIFGAGGEFRNFALNYTYDYTTSKLTNSGTGGSHEVSLLYRFGKDRIRLPKKSM